MEKTSYFFEKVDENPSKKSHFPGAAAGELNNVTEKSTLVKFEMIGWDSELELV